MTPTPTTMTEADGWKLVPLEPTPEMLEAGRRVQAHRLTIYRAMLSAAPPAPAPRDMAGTKVAGEAEHAKPPCLQADQLSDEPPLTMSIDTGVSLASPATPLAIVEGSPLLEWAVERWNAEVRHRPLQNIHRRSLDDVWRQVIRWAGGDPITLIGPSHDELLAGGNEQ